MQTVDWKPISRLPLSTTRVTVYDPTMCEGCRIITGCRVATRSVPVKIVDPDGVPVDNATHFCEDIQLPSS